MAEDEKENKVTIPARRCMRLNPEYVVAHVEAYPTSNEVEVFWKGFPVEDASMMDSATIPPETYLSELVDQAQARAKARMRRNLCGADSLAPPKTKKRRRQRPAPATPRMKVHRRRGSLTPAPTPAKKVLAPARKRKRLEEKVFVHTPRKKLHKRRAAFC